MQTLRKSYLSQSQWWLGDEIEYIKWDSNHSYNLNYETSTWNICYEPYLKSVLKYNTLDYTYDYFSTSTTRDNYYYDRVSPPPRPARERLREMLRARQAPLIISTRIPLRPPQNDREQRARETLRHWIGERKFRQFCRHGFVTLRGASGLVYQIFPGHKMTRVWKNGEFVEKLCVVLQGNYPPTDAIIMRFLLILNDEEEFRRIANKMQPFDTILLPKKVDMRSLPEILKELRSAA